MTPVEMIKQAKARYQDHKDWLTPPEWEHHKLSSMGCDPCFSYSLALELEICTATNELLQAGISDSMDKNKGLTKRIKELEKE